jgi:hypothetical protein
MLCPISMAGLMPQLSHSFGYFDDQDQRQLLRG